MPDRATGGPSVSCYRVASYEWDRVSRSFRPTTRSRMVGGLGGPQLESDAEPESEFTSERRRSWASILWHVEEGRGHAPHAPRAPPAA